MGLIRPGSSVLAGSLGCWDRVISEITTQTGSMLRPSPRHIMLSHSSLAVDHNRVRCRCSSFYSRILTVSCELGGWAGVELAGHSYF